MPEISVVIPTRGRPSLVCQAVESALAQTLCDLEVIVIIDGPDAETELALAAIPDRRLQVVPLQHSVGGSEARNEGARRARSPWVALLDDDDYWFPAKLQTQLSHARPKGLQILVTKFVVDDGGSKQEIWPRRFPHPAEDISEYLFCSSQNVFQTSTIVCSRELLVEVPFTKGLRRLQDWDWLLRALHHPSVVLVPVPEALSVYNCPDTAQSISNKFDWEGALAWARSNRTLMTAKAFRGFISKKCASDAGRQSMSFRKFFTLFSECAFSGVPHPVEATRFLMYYFLPVSTRRTMANARQRFRGVRAEQSPQLRFGGVPK